MKRKILIIVVPMVFLIAAFTPCYADLVTNGGFETGDFTGWGYTQDPYNYLGVDPLAAHSGNYGAYLGAIPPDDYDYLFQVVDTVPGQTYTFSFWLTNIYGTDNNFYVYWDDYSYYLLVLNNAPYFDWTQYSFQVTAQYDSSLVYFAGNNGPAYYYLDDVSVNPVPEPASMILLGLGLIGLAVYRKKFKG